MHQSTNFHQRPILFLAISHKIVNMVDRAWIFIYKTIFFICFFLFYLFVQSSIFSQTLNLDSLSATFTDVEDVDQSFYTELDSFRMAIEHYEKNRKTDERLVDAIQSWAKIFAIKDPVASMKAYEKSIRMAKNIGYEKGIANGKHEIGLLYFKEGFYPIAIGNIYESSMLHKKLGEWWQYGFSLIDIGNVYFKLMQYENARKYYKLAMQVFTSHQFKEKYEFALSVCNNNLGLVEMEKKNYKQALDYFNEGFRWRKSLNLEEYYGHSYKYIALAYKGMGKLDSAFKYYELAIHFDKLKGPKMELIRSHIGLGNLLTDMKDYHVAQSNLREALTISKLNGMQPMIIESANEIAKLYQIMDKKDSATKYFNMALENAKNYGDMDGRQLACEKLLEISRIEGNLERQLSYLQELLLIEKQKQEDIVLKKQLEYEVNKGDSDNEILESRNKMQKLIILFTTTILILLVFLLFYFFGSRRKYMKLNNDLENKNYEIIEQQKILEKVNNELSDYSSRIFHQNEEIMAQSESLSNAVIQLKELHKFKEGMLAMIVHDLKNPLNTILNQTKNIMVHESANQMLNMVNNILDLQKYEETSMPVDNRNIILNTVIENAMFHTRYLSEQKNIGIKNQISRNIEVFADAELLERIFINFLTNAIKYSPLNSNIKIRPETVEGNYLKINIMDNGPGILENAKTLIFEKFTQMISQNSGRTRSTGLGLAFCKMAVEAQQGKIGVEQNEGGGAIFWFTIPLSKSIEIFEDKVEKKLPLKLIVSEEDFEKLLPNILELKHTAIYEITEIRKIIDKIKAIGIPEIGGMLSAIENCSYSVNEENYLKLVGDLELLKEGKK